MNREIKFRAWIKETKQIISHNIINFNDFLHKNEKTYCGDIDFLMQFTGLKDKNGKDIYEGDLIGEPEGDFSSHESYEIIFHKGGFYMKNRTFDMIIMNWNLFNFCKEMEVKGNIYENPNLIQ